ncbi:hypothetical protein [Vannielia litorea]|nr:hypothetical protein [Vannielia litorea]
MEYGIASIALLALLGLLFSIDFTDGADDDPEPANRDLDSL